MMLTAVVLLAQLGVNGPAIDSAVMAGIDARVYPGAVVVIGRRDTVLHVRAYGRFTFDAGARAVDSDSTLFDLASLTKVVATTTAIMLLADDGRLDVDAPVSRYLPRFSGDEKTAVTVRQLLAHTSGLPAYRPFYERAENRDSMIAMVYREPLQRPPDRMAVYSDLNAILLGEIVEAVTGQRLDVFVSRAVFAPLDMEQTRFTLSRAERSRAMPVGRWRGTPVSGTVHDQNAARMEGVAGHAGLYSTGRDLARFAQFVLSDGAPLVSPQTFREFTLRQAGAGNRALGWETTPTPEEVSSAGTRLTSGSIGHTGFTGTSLWIDRQRDLFVLLLTNRVYTGSSFNALKRVRGAVADNAVSWVDDLVCRSPNPPPGMCA
jgi:CubicO group peptidase (beta-lactamase class C family)